jgi:hypothetical protein
MTIEMTAVENGVHYHSETYLANGRSFTADYTAGYDDLPTMVTGAKGVLLPVFLHKAVSKPGQQAAGLSLPTGTR